MSADLCPVCCESYNKSTRTKIMCPVGDCTYHACKACNRLYMINTTQEPHCMECRSAWDMAFTIKALNRSFVNGKYAQHRKTLLLEQQLSRIPDTMQAAINYKERMHEEQCLQKLQTNILELKQQIKLLRREQYDHRYRIRQLTWGGNNQDNPENAEENEITAEHNVTADRKKFNWPCPVPDCRGFLSSQYKCEICQTFSCPKCICVIGKSKHEPHTCIQENVLSANMIKADTKACPSCGVRISKIEGCDQMWCVECHTPFSWKTGRIETGTIHNPHFYEYNRKIGNGQQVRTPGDVLCGGLCSLRQLNQVTKIYEQAKTPYLSVSFHSNIMDHINQHPNARILYNIHRTVSHISHVDLPSYRTRATALQNTEQLRIKYILNEYTKQELQNIVYRNDIQKRKISEILRIYELLNVFSIERFARMIHDIGEIKLMSHKKKIVEDSIYEFNQLRMYCNEQLSNISVTYNQTVPIIADSWQIHNKKCTKQMLEKDSHSQLARTPHTETLNDAELAASAAI